MIRLLSTSYKHRDKSLDDGLERYAFGINIRHLYFWKILWNDKTTTYVFRTKN